MKEVSTQTLLRRWDMRWTCLKSVTFSVTLGMASLGGMAAEVNQNAPDFTLKGRTGENLRLAEQVGQVIFVNFWASWCGPCRQEMPELERLHQKYAPLGFKVLAINLDEQSQPAEKFLDKLTISFPVLFDPENKVSRAYGVAAMPTSFLIDRDGRLRYLHKGYQAGFEKTYETQIKALVRE